MTVEPDHVAFLVTRIPVGEDRWTDDEGALISGFHAMACMAAYRDWSAEFTFVCLLEDRHIDHFVCNIDDLTPPDFMGEVISEVVAFHQGKILAVTLHLGAYSHRVTPGNSETTQMESKFVITIPADGSILISDMHRELESLTPENDGKWNTGSLEYAVLDQNGDIKRIARELQEAIINHREKRDTNHV